MTATPIRLDEAHNYLDRVIGVLHDLSSHDRSPLVAVLEYLSSHIRDTRNEIAMLRSAPDDSQALASTADELEEIVTETARATNTIMDAAETIEKLSQQVPADTAAGLQDAATRIYEACTFQDITGQRIGKVVHALQALEERIAALVNACCDEETPATVAASTAAGDDALLNGPQLSGHANTQSEIDRLFEEL